MSKPEFVYVIYIQSPVKNVWDDDRGEVRAALYLAVIPGRAQREPGISK
jgi:hypothetical protein